jgi:hypothetical protein
MEKQIFSNIIETSDNMCDEDYETNCDKIKKIFSYTGPFIKKFFVNDYDNNNNFVIDNTCYVNIIHNDHNLAHRIYKNIEDEYIIIDEQTNEECIFKIITNTYNSVFTAILSNNNYLDRIAFYNNKLYISNMFIIELYNITCSDLKIIDPIKNTPIDKFSIYKIKSNDETDSFKLAIERLDYINLNNLIESCSTDVENKIITYNNEKYTLIEYAILKYVKLQSKKKNIIMSNVLVKIICYLLKYKYFRPPCFYALFMNINTINPILYDHILISMNYKNNEGFMFEYTLNLNKIKSITDLGLWIIEIIIENDKKNMFIQHLNTLSYIKKINSMSKTIESIINIIIKYKPQKIIKYMFTNEKLLTIHKCKMALFIENIEILELFLFDEEQINIEIAEMMILFIKDIVKNGLYKSFNFLFNKIFDKISEIKIDLSTILHELDGNFFDYNYENKIELLKNIYCKFPEITSYIVNNKTPLMKHSENGNNNIVKILFEMNNNYYFDDLYMEFRDDLFENFIHKACLNGHTSILAEFFNMMQKNLLILYFNQTNYEGRSPIMLAAINKHESTVNFLMSNYSPVSEIIDLNIKDIYGNTVYHYICNSEICLGIEIPNIKNKFGFFPENYLNISKSFYLFV